jgi:hypothetical protein
MPFLSSSRRSQPLGGPILAVTAVLVALAIVVAGMVSGYMWSLHVANAGAQTRAMDARLAAEQHRITQLRQEFAYRSRFVELGRWGDALGLQPAGGGQYAGSPAQLAQLAAERRKLIDEGLGTCGLPGQLACKPLGGAHGYTPQARQQMDSLIGDIAR